jgi:carbamoyltransferase
MAREAALITGCDQLCMAGGVSLNCVANGKLLTENVFEQIFIQPAAGDAGGSMGAALASSFIYFKEERKISEVTKSLNSGFLGPSYSSKDVELMNKKEKAVSQTYDSFDELVDFISEKMAQGKIIGWFQGRMEFGPRALGNRSILADPRNPQMQQQLNLNIKYREGFRPFAPAILEEKATDYFELKHASPYMLFVAPLKFEKRNVLPENYEELSLKERLDFLRSELPAITHLDFSARIQTVDKITHPSFHSLIHSFFKLTGCPILVNTSFNVRGEPMVCSPTDAYHCFMNTEMDYLVINNHVYSKKDQPFVSFSKKSIEFLND